MALKPGYGVCSSAGEPAQISGFGTRAQAATSHSGRLSTSGGDGQQPGPWVLPVEPVEGTEGTDERLLDEVLGVGRRTSPPARGPNGYRHYDPDLVMRTADGPFPMETTYTWEPTDVGRTHMTLRNRGNPLGFAKLTAPVVERGMRRATTKDLLRLKAIVESRESR